MEITITKKGAEMKTNDWKEGQTVSCHENLAELFIKNGLAEGPEVKESKPTKPTKPTKK